MTEKAIKSPSFQHRDAQSIIMGLSLLDKKIKKSNAKAMRKAFIKVKNIEKDKQLGIFRWYMLELQEDSDIKALIDDFKTDPDIQNATPDWIAYPVDAPNDPLYPSQWGHNNTGQLLDYCWGCGGHPNGTPVGTFGYDGNIEWAWTALGSYGDPNRVIAIIDTGVDSEHPDLNQVTGYDFGSNDGNPNDDSARSWTRNRLCWSSGSNCKQWNRYCRCCRWLQHYAIESRQQCRYDVLFINSKCNCIMLLIMVQILSA